MANTNGRKPGRTNDDAWYDHEAERHLIADLIGLPHRVPEAATLIRPEHLSPGMGNALHAIYQAHNDGGGVIDVHQLAREPGVPSGLPQLLNGHGSGAWQRYARELVDLAYRRTVSAHADEIKHAAKAGETARVYDLTNRLEDLTRTAIATPDLDRPAPDVIELLDAEEPDFDWLVPGLLERGDRCIVTGEEGKGKSTLLRQIAMRAASGLDPFTDTSIPPINVLYVDVENSRRQIRRQLRPLTTAAADAYQPGRLRFEIRTNGLDLLDPRDIAWLHAAVDRNQPDLVVIGPLYKLAAGDPIKEETARGVAQVIDDLRARTGTTWLIEAHTPYADGSRAKRPIRPYGASLWSRWPEFGICLTDTGALDHWRGPRDMRLWPKALDRATPWPWAPRDVPAETEEWHGPSQCSEAIVTIIEEGTAAHWTIKQLTDQLRARGRSYRDQTIRAAAEMAVNDGRLLSKLGPRNARLYFTDGPQGSLDDTF